MPRELPYYGIHQETILSLIEIMKMYLNHQENSFIYGPGLRRVLWTQGCSLRCKGCWNKEMWEFNKNSYVEIDDLVADILTDKELEGITLLGGEPLDQFEASLELLKKIKTQSQLSIILYTGYEIPEIFQTNKQEIIPFADILITGRFEPSQRNLQTNGSLIGSDNQQIIFISKRYSKKDIPEKNQVEITLSHSEISILGYPAGLNKNNLK